MTADIFKKPFAVPQYGKHVMGPEMEESLTVTAKVNVGRKPEVGE